MTRVARLLYPRLLWFVVATLAGGGCDLQTKSWAQETLSALPGKTMVIAAPWLDFSLTYNRGTAFSVIPNLGGGARLFFGVLALVIVGFLAVLVVRWRSDRGEALALGALAGGALGNGVDRALRSAPGGGTGVIDFVKLNVKGPWGEYWPIFNVADVLVAIGIGYFVLRRILERKKGDPQGGPSTPSEAPASS